MCWGFNCNTATRSTTNPTRIFAVRCLLTPEKFIHSLGGWLDPQIRAGRRGEMRRILDRSRKWLAGCWVHSLVTTLTELPRLQRDKDRRIFVFVDVKHCGNFASSLPPVITLSLCHHTISSSIHFLYLADPLSLFSPYILPVAWLSSGLCPDRPKGWIPIIIIIIFCPELLASWRWRRRVPSTRCFFLPDYVQPVTARSAFGVSFILSAFIRQ